MEKLLWLQKKTNKEYYLENQAQRFIDEFCPFNYFDIKKAIRICIEIGEDWQYLYDTLDEAKENMDCEMGDIDLKAIIIRRITQEVSNSFEEKGLTEIAEAVLNHEENREILKKFVLKNSEYMTDFNRKEIWFFKHFKLI